MIEHEHEVGVFIPPAVSGCNFVHFAIDNADWHEKTPDGTTFQAMTTNVYGYERTSTDSTLQEPDRTTEDMCIFEDLQQTFHLEENKLITLSEVLPQKHQHTCDKNDETLPLVDKSTCAMS